MQVIFKCNGVVVNEHSKGYNTYCNPFGEHIPAVGDFVLLGERTPRRLGNSDCGVMTKYIVISRTFSALEDYNNIYSERTCVVELKEVES